MSLLSRKPPTRHQVDPYVRGNGTFVNAYWRGQGIPMRQSSRIVKWEKPAIPVDSPVKGDVIDPLILSYNYDYKEKTARPVSFRLSLITSEDVRGYENEEWLEMFLKVFPNIDNSIREGYTVDDVSTEHSPFEWDRWIITLSLRHNVPEVETKDVEKKYVERLARKTLPSPQAVEEEFEETEGA